MVVPDTDQSGTNSKTPAKSNALLRRFALALAFATLAILALAKIIMLPVKTTYKYYLVHANSGLDLKMRLSDEWVLTKPIGSNTFKGEMRELFMGKESGCEFVKKKPDGFRRFLAQVRFPFIQTSSVSSRINLFPTTSSPAYKGFTLSQIRDNTMNSDSKSYGDPKSMNGSFLKHVNVGYDSLKIGPAFASETVYPGGSMMGQFEDIANRRSNYRFVLYSPMYKGERWVTMELYARYPTTTENVIKGEVQDLVSHLEVVGERVVKFKL